MPNEKYLDYAGLQYYHEKLNLDLASMLMTDDDLDIVLFDELGIVPPLPETWTESANGTLNLALGNAFSYWPEGAGTKTVSITNGTTAGVSHFFLKLTDAGNFFVEWGSNIQWKDESEPEWQAFHEDIILFKRNDGGNTWIAQVLQTNSIQEYWKFTIQIPESKTIYIPLDNHVDAIDWGDGSSIETVQHNSYGDSFRFTYHTYSLAGIYQIKVQSDNFANCYMATDDSDPDLGNNSGYYYYDCNIEPYAISIDSPLPCIRGTYQWPDDSSISVDDALDNCFCGYNKLVSIPDKIFYNNSHVKSFRGCFTGCSSLQSIPAGLFDNNTAVVSTPTVPYQDYGGFDSCFSGCSSLQSIPSGLFDSNVAVTSFQWCFSSCSSLQSIPSGLFDKNTAVTTFAYCFNGCSSIQSIPSGLFDSNVAVTSFNSCFFGCSSIQSIPSGLFDKNTAATSFPSCFRGCSSIQSIPAGLFDSNVAVTDFDGCFRGCSSLQSIPSGLFDKNTAVTYFESCFHDCTYLQSIPEGLFDKNTAVTYFRWCFYNCTSLNNFTLHIGSSLVTNCTDFVTKKTGTTRTIYVPSGSTTQTKFNAVASSLGLTIVGV